MTPAAPSGFLLATLEVLAALFVFVVGLVALITLVLFVIDVSQTKHAIRRNYPVIGRFRYLFERLGEFFRQYFFAMDREEMPFNRAERTWVYQAAKNADSTVPFGSTKDLRPTGSVFFVNAPFPTLHADAVPPKPVTIGEYADYPYTPRSFFNVSAMSYGALSQPAVRALSRGARHAGCWLNTGEGGLSPYHLEGGCDIVFQIGTAKYGVRDADGRLDDDKLREVAAHDQVRMLELKLSQGAKPGKGGILPACKVTPEIARIRGIPAYQASISPNRHPEIGTVADLLDTIERIRRVTRRPTGFKTVMGSRGWLEEVLRLVLARGPERAPDFITVDGAEGGSGAAPMSLMDNMGLPLREALPAVVDALTAYGLRERIKVVASGKLVTPSNVAWALCMGADFVVSARGFMFALGCIQAMQCNRDTCPTGVTTHNPKLQRGLVAEDKATRVMHYAKHITREVGIIAHACGVRYPQELARHHARVVIDSGTSRGMDELFPEVTPVDPRPREAASGNRPAD
ncbi:MAG: FMN-binding glutamate synthase family protein [Gammaproteobacteria bacterium]|nr:FMN-binding glutamate synthase family protein [Gammaproteobacteria bacterium]